MECGGKRQRDTAFGSAGAGGWQDAVSEPDAFSPTRASRPPAIPSESGVALTLPAALQGLRTARLARSLQNAYSASMNAAIAAPPLLSTEAAETARTLIRQFPECFWFWNRDAAIETAEDARLVVQNLREYGGHRAWREAQRLHACL